MNVGAKIFGSPSGEPKHHNQTNAQKKCEKLLTLPRHSDSKNAEIRLGISDGIISVTVRDNGKRMSVERLAEIRSNASGVGIRGMRERLRQLGGEISIESDASGTTVLASLPVPSPQKDQSN